MGIMINLTKDVMILKTGKELEHSIIKAISNAKKCVCENLFGEPNISPSQITASSRNKYNKASIILIFEDHETPSTSPNYNSTWVKNIYECTKKTPSLALAKTVVPEAKHAILNKLYLARLCQDALIILHFLWHEGAALLPVEAKRPALKKPDRTGTKFFEYAAPTYPEVLALVRKPFLTHVSYEGVKDVTSVMKPTALSNFDWYAWRMIRASTWYRIEDIDPRDVAACAEALWNSRRRKTNWNEYPLAPKAFFAYVKKLYPERIALEQPDNNIKNDVYASRHAIASGEFHIAEEHNKTAKIWLNYQGKFLTHLKHKGIKSLKGIKLALSIFNSFLFEELPNQRKETPPLPKHFTRTHLEGDNFDGLLKFLRKDRSPATWKAILYKLDQFFDYLVIHANSDKNVFGFANPISEIDYPIVRRHSSTVKPAFNSEHFAPLLQYCYAVEAFSWYLAEKVHNHQFNVYDRDFRASINSKNWHDSHKVIQTEKLGYVPIIFYKNPYYDSTKPVSANNRRMTFEPLKLIPRFLIPVREQPTNNNGCWLYYPQLNHIQHNIIALETGIRSMHIRWLDRRTYDHWIDRSRKLDPICTLHVNTDKSHAAWNSFVTKSVIEVLDRQKKTHSWIADSYSDQEIWYDHHEESPFGKIVTLFPSGGKPGPLTPSSYSHYFRRLIFAFDLFARYSLGMRTTSAIPAELGEIESIDDPTDFLKAIKLVNEACKLIEHTPHSCRVSVVSEYITILPPEIIGNYITGQATVSHVLYYAKLDPTYLKNCSEHQKLAVDQNWIVERPAFSEIKTEDPMSALQRAFQKNKEQSLIDFGAISFEREHNDEILSGIIALKKQVIEALAFMPTHICPFGNNCPEDVRRDLGAIPGLRMPCGGCYYSIKTVDHLPRILGLIRSLTDECSELESYLAEARKQGASLESLAHKAAHKKYLAAEIIAWSVTVHCLEQMHNEIKSRSKFLVERPEIVTQQLQLIATDGGSISNLIARTVEAKTHAEFFTPQLKQQVLFARQKLLAFTGDYSRLLQEAPTGFSLIDEFRGLIRSICETTNLSLDELTAALQTPITIGRAETVLRLVSKAGDRKE
jgi:hypothetical protein